MVNTTQIQPDSGRVLLRDGTAATLTVAAPEDVQGLDSFFQNLATESGLHRYLSKPIPDSGLAQALCAASNSEQQWTLLVKRHLEGAERIVAVGSYESRGDGAAEISVGVDDRLLGMGLGTILLERLAAVAIQNGFRRFQAIAETDNHRMIEVLRRSGFPVRERMEAGMVEIDFDVTRNESNILLSEMRDRLSAAASIRPFFRPNAVAIAGASRDASSIGYRIVDEFLRAGFRGPVYAVNPNAPEVHSIKTHASVRDVPGPVDLVIIAVPRDAVFGVVDDCAAHGVRALVVITAGFSEAGAEGRELQEQLLQKVRGYGMRMIGPNCMGLLNTDPAVRLNASFSPVFPAPGNLAMSSQSGALGLAVLALAAERQLGFSTFISVGNKADVSGNDLLQYWETDLHTGVILLYLESFGNPRRFARIARRVGRSKPIVAMKAGRSSSGRRAAGSHTAALAANDVAVDALFRQTGVIRAETIDGMFDIASVLGSQPLPQSRRVAIVTNAGGPGILCADACEAGGLSIAELSEAVRNKLRTFLPAAASVTNPVDMVASAGPESYRQTIATVLASPDIDSLIVIYIPVDRGDTKPFADAIRTGVEEGRAVGGEGKPVLACLMTRAMRQEPLKTRDEVIPVYSFPEAPAMALSKCAAYAEWKLEPPGVIRGFVDTDVKAARYIVREALRQRGNGWLNPGEIRAVLKAFGIPQPSGAFARTADEAVQIAERVGFPVAVKLISPAIVHKSEVGGIRLNVSSEEEVRQAFDQMQAASLKASSIPAEGVLVQRMIKGGIELMSGITNDPLFGPLLAFGMGGVNVEIVNDVQFRVTPLTDIDVRQMVRGIRGFRLLKGYRGHPPADVDAVEEVLLRLSRLAEEIPEIAEMDVNPLIALAPGQGCSAVDARIRVAGNFGANPSPKGRGWPEGPGEG
jgi:acetyl coenzyme A synthetase (ADP forming)-like protein